MPKFPLFGRKSLQFCAYIEVKKSHLHSHLIKGMPVEILDLLDH